MNLFRRVSLPRFPELVLPFLSYFFEELLEEREKKEKGKGTKTSVLNTT